MIAFAVLSAPADDGDEAFTGQPTNTFLDGAPGQAAMPRNAGRASAEAALLLRWRIALDAAERQIDEKAKRIGFQRLVVVGLEDACERAAHWLSDRARPRIDTATDNIESLGGFHHASGGFGNGAAVFVWVGRFHLLVSKSRSRSAREYSFVRSSLDGVMSPRFSMRQSDTREMPPSIWQASSVGYASRSIERPPVSEDCGVVIPHKQMCQFVSQWKRNKDAEAQSNLHHLRPLKA
jgi:hypothetical protein